MITGDYYSRYCKNKLYYEQCNDEDIANNQCPTECKKYISWYKYPTHVNSMDNYDNFCNFMKKQGACKYDEINNKCKNVCEINRQNR